MWWKKDTENISRFFLLFCTCLAFITSIFFCLWFHSDWKYKAVELCYFRRIPRENNREIRKITALNFLLLSNNYCFISYRIFSVIKSERLRILKPLITRVFWLKTYLYVHDSLRYSKCIKTSGCHLVFGLGSKGGRCTQI